MQQVSSVYLTLEQLYEKAGTGIAAATSDKVEYTYKITNNGMLSLYEVAIEDEKLQMSGVYITCTDVDSTTATGIGHGAFTGLASYPDNGLKPAASLTCTAQDGVTQAEVSRRGHMCILLLFYRRRSVTVTNDRPGGLSGNRINSRTVEHKVYIPAWTSACPILSNVLQVLGVNTASSTSVDEQSV